MIIEFEDATGICPIASDQVVNWVELLLASETEEEVELAIRVVDANESQKLNKIFRGQDHPTNVLSFPADIQLPKGPKILGDIAICLPLSNNRRNKRLDQHFAHGGSRMLHLWATTRRRA